MNETHPGNTPSEQGESQPSQSKLRTWFRRVFADPKKRLWVIIGSTLVLATMVGVVIFALTRQPAPAPEPTPSPTPTPTPTPTELHSNLDGVLVDADRATRHPLAIMIENLPLIRPQTGMSEASIVYESIVEGGITRFMAVYGHSYPERVGPVRSARTQFVDFAEEFVPNSAYYAHVGGSEDALGKIKVDKIYDLDQFNVGNKAYQRFPKKGLATEHTMYTFPQKLYDVARERGYEQGSNFRAWLFKEDADMVSRPDAQTITIPFSSAPYTVKYVYDKNANRYNRFLAGVEHKDANNDRQLTPKNIIVHFASYESLKKGVQRVGVIGEGNAKIFRDGKVIDAKWRKSSSRDRTIYTEAATGAEIQFNRGQIFVEVAKIGTTISVQ